MGYEETFEERIFESLLRKNEKQTQEIRALKEQIKLLQEKIDAINTRIFDRAR